MRKIDRFLQYLDYKGITENRATIDCDLSKGLIGQAKSGKSDLGNKAVEKILKFYQDLSKVWLLTGEGEMLITSQKNSQVIENNTGTAINGDNATVTPSTSSKEFHTMLEMLKIKDEQIGELISQNGKLMTIIETLTSK